MTDFLKAVGQTNKLLLIEEFNPNITNLIDIMNQKISEPEKLVQEIQEKLEVKSYDDFLKKFDPVIYQWDGKDANGNPVLYYDTKPPASDNYCIIRVSEQEYFKSIVELYKKKITSGDTNLNADYEIIAKKLDPANVIKQAKNVRKSLDSAYREYRSLKDANAAASEINACVDVIDSLRDKAAQLYENNFIGILALAAGDYKAVVETMKKQIQNRKDDNSVTFREMLEEGRKVAGIEIAEKPSAFLEEGKETLPAELDNSAKNAVALNKTALESINITYRKTFDKDGNISLIPYDEAQLPKIVNPVQEKDDELAKEVTSLVAYDFEEAVGNSFNNSDFVKNVVLQALTIGTNYLPELSLSEAEQTYQKMIGYYKNCQEELINAIQRVVQKLLDVKIFFDQAIPEGQQELSGQTSVIVSNCTLNDLMDGATCDNFKEYIKSVGDQDNKTNIAFALIPGVTDKDFRVKEATVAEKEIRPRSQRKAEEQAKLKTDAPTLDNLAAAVSVLKEKKIMTFFNYTANEETGFSKFNMSKLNKYMDNVAGKLEGEDYAVFVYPNFTVLPESFSTHTFDDITIHGVGQYVDAAYVAAGLVVASQDPQYLKKAIHKDGKVVDAGYPGVRIDLEEYQTEMITKMNCENLLKMSSDVKEKIRESAFGFCFTSSGANSIDGKGVKNSYVYKARTMGKDKGSISYKPIYKVLTKDFVERYLNTFPSVNKETLDYFKENIIKAEWINNAILDERVINNILRKDEDIECVTEGNILNITLKFSSGNEEFSINMKEA